MTNKVYDRITAKQVLNKVREEKMPFGWSMNPYRGCAHGCSFCYARAYQSFIGCAANDEFQNHIMIKANAAEALEAQLMKLIRRFHGNLESVRRHIGWVAIGTASDPYQPVEKDAKITRQCLQVLGKYRIPVSITTRSPLILRDLDLLIQMNIVAINISINTLRSDLTRKLEPASPLPMKRLEAVQKLNEHGVKAGAFVAPIMPYITDQLEDVEQLFCAVKQHKASFAVTSLLRLTPDVKVWFFHTLRAHFPHLVARYAKLYQTANADRSYSDQVMSRIHSLADQYGLLQLHPEEEYHSSVIRVENEPEQLAFPF